MVYVYNMLYIIVNVLFLNRNVNIYANNNNLC